MIYPMNDLIDALEAVIGKFYVVGGVCRRMLTGISYDECDIDIVSIDKEPIEVALMVDGGSWRGGMGSRNFEFRERKINCLPMIGNIRETLDSFDFTCCQLAYASWDAERTIFTTEGDAIRHVRERMLVPTEFILKSTDNDLLDRSWCRMAKLMREGFTMSRDNLLSMCDHWQEMKVKYMGNNGESSDPDGPVEVLGATAEVVF